MTDANDYPAYIDRRDAAVIEQLTEGETYRVNEIKELYKTHTDIRREATARERKKTLLQSPCFECESVGWFTYTGTGSE